jgi:hypothetical protein
MGLRLGKVRLDVMTQKSKILVDAKKIASKTGSYLERCTTTRGAVFVSVDPVSTSLLSLEMVLDKEVESGAIQVGLA